MFGGFMNRTSSFALVAAAGLLMGGWSLSAKAADLGGDCCSDLEERVAELEQTSVRKGNRKVSLELSGQVNKALVAWNDGKTSDAFIEDNNLSSTRLRLKGTGQMAPGWKAGFYMEYEFRDSSSNLNDQTSQSNRSLETALRIRQENVFIESEKFGRVTLGQQNPAGKDIELINLSGALLDPENYYANSFKIRDNNLGNTAGFSGRIANASRLGWGTIANTFDPGRLQGVRYDTPSIYGFIASAFWGENDYWDIALRYQKEWNSIRVAAGVSYAYSGDPVRGIANYGGGQLAGTAGNNIDLPNFQSKADVIQGSASIMHVPTGLYITGAAGTRSLSNPGFTVGNGLSNKDGSFYNVQVGITKRWFEVGATTLFGDYANYSDQGVGARYDGTLTGPARTITSSDVDRWGFGITQAFDGSALELYSNYVHYSADLKVCSGANACAAGTTVSAKPQDFDAVITGARIKF